MVAEKLASAEPVDQFFAEITGIWRWFWSRPNHSHGSRLNLKKICPRSLWINLWTMLKKNSCPT